jgi:hypothetical protein
LLPVLNLHKVRGAIALLAMLFSTASHSYGQKYFNGRSELGWVAGACNYHGDLSHGLNLKNTRPMGGMYYKYQFSGFFSYRLQASMLNIRGTDDGDRSYDVRNLSFQTNIYEWANMFEFNFQSFGLNYGDEQFSPYFFSGLNGFFFNPTRLENKDVDLRNLKTEGQKRSYSQFQPAVPIGFGLKAMSRPKKQGGVWIMALEGCWRKTFTDYLDDVNGEYPNHQALLDKQNQAGAQYSHAQTMNGQAPYSTGTMRGDTHLKDWYYSINLTLAFRFPNPKCASF